MASPRTTSQSPIVGRDVEIAAIERALGELSRGRGNVMMFAGEPGIGKSTLARFAADAAGGKAIPVYWGFAWEAGGAPAYWPWTQLLDSLVRERQPSHTLTKDLHRILPDTGQESSEPSLGPDQARFRLMESVRRLFAEMSATGPLVAVFEDLHAADVDSLNLLHYLARHVTTMPVLVIGTYRDVEARSSPAAAPLWRTCRDAEVHALGRLGEQDVRDYLAARESAATSEARVQQLLTTTEGNPLFLSELVGLLTVQHDDGVRLPASVQQVIEQQLGLLPEESASLLATASILGREFNCDALAELQGVSSDECKALLCAAIDAGMLRQKAEGLFRFAHVLHRDVLYRSLDSPTRSALHLRYADHLRRSIGTGGTERWTELAEHLRAAGDDYLDKAIEAWRAAAAYELKRLAFDDASASMKKALAAFGGGPKYAPEERYRLLLECAEATLLAGDTETGRGYCRDAFNIARTLGDPGLMSEAALTWGSAIVVANVDADLVGALRESLDALPAEDSARRSRVQARLAGALQPAPNPAEPMAMARDAIALARTTGNEQVMYDVLRSAISALMDFAPAKECFELNEEFGALAAALGDVPGQFRSKLRLMIDACGIADRQKMDRAIDECERLAERIALPHYRWRAASARAMQATIDGQFSRACRLLDEAQGHADAVDDAEARITLPLQRFFLLIEWDSGEVGSLESIEASLNNAYASGMAEAEFFVAPFIASHVAPLNPAMARKLLGNKAIVERTFAGGDRYSLCRLGEVAAAAGNREIAERALRQNLAYAGECATLGLMGSCCVGPVAWSLGQILGGLGRYTEALRFLEQALQVAEAMRAPPWLARIHASIADIASAAGQSDLAFKHEREANGMMAALSLRVTRSAGVESVVAPRSTPSGDFDMRRHGDLWEINYCGDSLMMPNSKGLEMLAKLVDTPDVDVHVLDLSGSSGARDQSDTGPQLDATARRSYEARLRELDEELEEATEFGDTGRAEAARTEIEFISRELGRAFGLGGRARRSGNAAERARVNVRRRLVDAIERISKERPDAGRYLQNTIKTGTYCRYSPM